MRAEQKSLGKRFCVQVLMYHSISPEPGPTCISSNTFEMQISALGYCGYQVVTLADLVEWRAGRLNLPDRCAVITFDDAFADFFVSAAPVLSAHG